MPEMLKENYEFSIVHHVDKILAVGREEVVEKVWSTKAQFSWSCVCAGLVVSAAIWAKLLTLGQNLGVEGSQLCYYSGAFRS